MCTLCVGGTEVYVYSTGGLPNMGDKGFLAADNSINGTLLCVWGYLRSM
jgi:hypothetical protein